MRAAGAAHKEPDVRVSEFTDCDLELPSAQILATLGCPPGQRVHGRLRRQIETAVGEIRERMACRFAYRSHPICVESGRVHVGDKETLRSARLAQAMRPCRRVYAYVVTLGSEVDEYIDACMQRRPDYGVVVDAAASAAAESMVARVEQEIAESLPPTQALGLPFSAGYCDWSVREQEKVFALLPPGAAGVVLSDDFMMSPRKSISGLFGAGLVDDVTEAACPCSSCPRRDCNHRRRPYTGRSNERLDDQRLVRPHRGRPTDLSLRAAQR